MKPYEMFITTKASARRHEMTLEDVWFSDDDEIKNETITENKTGTNTRITTVYNAPRVNTYELNRKLQGFVNAHKNLYDVDRHSLYRSFKIPKKSGGLRPIDAPDWELMSALRELKSILEQSFHTRWLYHTSAFAYINGRSTIDCVKKHQLNKSRWFAKFDVHNFFGSTTLDFVMSMFSKIFPFSMLIPTIHGRDSLSSALELCFLDGVLPQGTPISPMITNIMMIPVDYMMEKYCRENGLVYSRYADDFLISSRESFDFRAVEQKIVDVLKEFGAPFELNRTKTRYGSSAGANWNFGVMLNKDNQMTIGRARKRQFESMLFSYGRDKKAGINWTIDDVRHMEGLRSYYKMVEGDAIDRIVQHISEKVGANIMAMIKTDLKTLC